MNPKFKYFKFRRIIKNKHFWLQKTFSSEKELINFIKRTNYDDIYESAGHFLDYKLYNREEWIKEIPIDSKLNKTPKNLIDYDYHSDWDNQEGKNIIKGIKFMRKEGYKETLIKETSKGNIQVKYSNFLSRFKTHKEGFVEISRLNKELVKFGADPLVNVDGDTHQVFRFYHPDVPTKHHSGFVVREVSRDYVKTIKPKIKPNKPQNILTKVFWKGIISSYDKNKNLFFIKNPNLDTLKKAQVIYSLGNIYEVIFEDEIYYFSEKVFDINRLRKIHKFLSSDFNTFNYLRISEKISEEYGIISSGIKRINMFPMEVKGFFVPLYKDILRKDVSKYKIRYNVVLTKV